MLRAGLDSVASGICKMCGNRRTPLVWMLVLTHLCFVSTKNFANNDAPVSVTDATCSNIAGDYYFWGAIEVDGKKTRISFLQRLIRPSRTAIQSVRITPIKSGEFSMSFLGAGGNVVGDDVRVITNCRSGQWEESESYEGYSDGTVVRETRVWRYSRNEIGALIIEFHAISTSRYLMGFRSPKTTQNYATFSPMSK